MYDEKACMRWVRGALQGRVAVDSRAARSLRNSAMHLRKACNHPYLFLAGQQPPYEPGDPEELVRASGKLHALDNILPKLRATGAPSPLQYISFLAYCYCPGFFN